MSKSTLSVIKFSEVYQEGVGDFVFPIKTRLLLEPGSGCLKCGFAVPKRMIKKAVVRNTIKRRMREAFGKYKNVVRGTFLENQDMSIIFIYSHKQELPFSVIEKSIEQYVYKLSKYSE